MQICPDCGASNSDAAKFCNDCGKALTGAIKTPAPTRVPPVQSPEPEHLAHRARSTLAEGIAHQPPPSPAHQRRADILFVLDCTGSMGGEINAIRDAITGFADTIQSDGVQVRVGLIEFRDRLCGEEHRALTFAGAVFTQNPVMFRQEVAKLTAGGGGDEPESSLDALLLASRQPFDPEANKVIVLVTDAPPHIPDQEAQSIDDVATALKTIHVDQLYLVIRTQDPNSQIYLKLLAGRKGLAFELGKGNDFRKRAEDFQKTLMALGKTISAATR
jgi:hypothetical protein